MNITLLPYFRKASKNNICMSPFVISKAIVPGATTSLLVIKPAAKGMIGGC